MGGDAEEELTPVVKTDSPGSEIADEPSDETEALGLTKGRQFVERARSAMASVRIVIVVQTKSHVAT